MEPIAIIGYAHRFPGGADTPSKFWDLLTSGRNISREPEPEQLNLAKSYNKNGDHHGSTNVLKLYFLDEDSSLFNAAFFGISPHEAEAIDPQQRVLLETVFEASESSGIPLAGLRGSRTSVYVGVMTNDYADVQARDVQDMNAYTASGTSRAMLANRVSYAFDLRGNSVCLDTACSSSLVALHQAAQDLRDTGPTGYDMAIVAGCSLLLDPLMYITESKLHMLSPTGTSKMWDAGADGYARGEGVAAVLIKPLNKALRDGHFIHGVIRATGANSDGRTPGITMPSATAQAQLIRDTYAAAGLNIKDLNDRCQYFEAHGTGTPAGDPIEARGIFDSFFGDLPRDTDKVPLPVGSVKTNIGHLEGCAGLAGLIKVLQAMAYNIVPPNLHFKKLNPAIEPLAHLLHVPTKAIPWPDRPAGQPKRASVNSFRFGGTNAHVIIESFEAGGGIVVADDGKNVGDERLMVPIVLSANTEAALQKRALGLRDYLAKNPRVNIKDLAWTLMARRSELPVRMAVAANCSQALAEKLIDATNTEPGGKMLALGTPFKPLVSPADGIGILGVFIGQGAQWAGMGRELLSHNVVFRNSINRCQEALDSLPTADRPNWNIAQELPKEEQQSRVSKAEFAQPTTTAVEIALVDVLLTYGVAFNAVVGHSSGEIAACYAAGILSLKDAIRIAYYRGRHAGLAREDGAMLAVGLGWEEAESQVTGAAGYRGRLWLAARNSPDSVTISGDADAAKEAHAELQSRGIFSRLLRTEKAYHSPHMQACSDSYLESIQACGVTPMPPRPGCVWVSSVDGNADRYWDNDVAALGGQYWIDNMVQPVLFTDAVEEALTNGGPFDVAVEIGPHPALKGPVGQTVQLLLSRKIPYCGAMTRGADSVKALVDALGFLWCGWGGDSIKWPGATPLPNLLNDLPAYPWDHAQPIWRESRILRNHRLR
ncbi:hypothetical protein MCOR25_009893 [Pyricularia grisea]|nr:hypothetical protein MCOR25_009893 [Pyricularia grisea]